MSPVLEPLLRKETKDDREMTQKLTKTATSALERAEAIKKAIAKRPPQRTVSEDLLENIPAPPTEDLAGLNLDDVPEPPKLDDPPPAAGAVGGPVAPPSAASGYSEEEKRVLARTSLINGRQYVPFMRGDLREKFAFALPWSDHHGKLALAPKQGRAGGVGGQNT